MAGNPIKFTSISYRTILNDINADPLLKDKPEWYKRIHAGIGALVGVIANAIANLAFLRTSFTRQSTIDHLEAIDYQLGAPQTSNGPLKFYLDADSVVFPVLFPKIDLIGITSGGSRQSSLRFEARAQLNVVAVADTFTASDITDELTLTTEDFETGDKVRVASGGTLPIPLAAGIDYYVIRISAGVIKLALSLQNAKNNTFIDITTTGAGVHTIDLFSFNANVWQQETRFLQTIGASDGLTGFQQFNFTDLKVIPSEVVLDIGGDTTWTRVDTFVNSTPSSKHFLVRFRTNLTPYIEFGNGILGLVPPANDIVATYAFGGGTISISSAGRINVYGGANTLIFGVENLVDITGGADGESLASAKKLGPILLKTRDLFYTAEDGAALAEDFPGVAYAKVVSNAFGVFRPELVVVPNGGGVPTSTLKTDLKDELEKKSQYEVAIVTVNDIIYVVVPFTSAVKILPGFLFADVKPFYDIASTMFFHETTNELLEIWDEGRDTAAAVIFINTIHGTSFSTTAEIAELEKILDGLQPVVFGRDIQDSDIKGFLDNFVSGVDFLTISAPPFPIVLNNNQITTAGVILTTEIP